jgi:hypothetical protein
MALAGKIDKPLDYFVNQFTLVAMNRYPDVAGPPRSYIAPLLIVVIIGAVLYAGFWWYLQGLDGDCRQQCLAKGHKDYRYVEPTGSGKYFRRGSCSCLP